MSVSCMFLIWESCPKVVHWSKYVEQKRKSQPGQEKAIPLEWVSVAIKWVFPWQSQTKKRKLRGRVRRMNTGKTKYKLPMPTKNLGSASALRFRKNRQKRCKDGNYGLHRNPMVRSPYRLTFGLHISFRKWVKTNSPPSSSKMGISVRLQ